MRNHGQTITDNHSKKNTSIQQTTTQNNNNNRTSIRSSTTTSFISKKQKQRATKMATTTTTSTTSTGGKNGDKRTGGIGWAGSLVGSENPNNNLGYRYSNPLKRYKRTGDDEKETEFPSNVVVQFSNRQGDELASPLDVPTESSVDDLQALVHSLLNTDDDGADSSIKNNKSIPYSFYAKIEKENGTVDEIEITSSILDFLKQHQDVVSTEITLQLTYQPLAVFKVRPVTRCTSTMPGHTEAILHVSYSPDGQNLASGGGDTTVRFWDTNTSLPKATCKQHTDHVLCTAWSPDGKYFASADKRGTLIIWDPNQRGRKNNSNTTGTDGTADATAAKKKVPNASEPIWVKSQAHKQYITSLAWEPLHLNEGRGERLITSSKDGTCKIWNVRTRQSLVTLSGHVDSVEAVRWGGEGFIYTASRDRTIKVWTAKDGDTLGKLVRTLKGHAHRVNTLALSSDYVCRTGPYEFAPSGRPKRTFEMPGDTDDDIRKAKYQAALERYQTFRDQQDGGHQERLVSGSDDYTLFLWHPISDKHPVKRLTGHQQAVNHIQFSPDGRYFASASFDKKVKLWNGYTGDFLRTLTGHVGAVYQVAWSSDSRFLVSASKDSTAKLWEVPSGKAAKATLPGHADEVYALDWSPNGASVATGSKDRTIKIWKH
jgi:ribosome assembly protein 4